MDVRVFVLLKYRVESRLQKYADNSLVKIFRSWSMLVFLRVR